MATRPAPAHEDHGIGRRGQQETQQRDRGGIAELLAQAARRRRVLGAEIQLLKGVARDGQQHALRGLDLAEVRVVYLGFFGVAGHGVKM